MNPALTFCLSLLLAGPILAISLNFLPIRNSGRAARLASYCIGMSLLSAVCLLSVAARPPQLTLYSLLQLNALSLLLSTLILYVSFVVHRFSLRFMDGDRLYRDYFARLATLTLSAVIMVLTDNLILFWFFWSVSNLLLVRLMMHKKTWDAAKNAGMVAVYTLLAGSICLLLGLLLLSKVSGESSLHSMVHHKTWTTSPLFSLALSLIGIAALTQSALWPFHRWLVSSLNSPTPVSAFMHAGLVNGGGILLVKFAPLFALHGALLTILFVLGAISACLGTTWKLMQHDIKRMLACSTLAQMGFMIMQCGLGLFAAAIAHLCWHGLFKAYLFLSSGSALNQQSNSIASPVKPTNITWLLTLLGGIVTMSCFACIANKTMFSLQTDTFVLFFAFIAGAQIMLTILQGRHTLLRILSALSLVTIAGLMYGGSIHLIESLLPDLSAMQLHQISSLHLIVLVIFAISWVLFNLRPAKHWHPSTFGCWLYMKLYNASQPLACTISTERMHYHF